MNDGAVVLIGGCIVGYPQYQVYQQRLAGEAELERQKYEKQVSVQSAMAKKESATLLAEADVLRAKGVAEANASPSSITKTICVGCGPIATKKPSTPPPKPDYPSWRQGNGDVPAN